MLKEMFVITTVSHPVCPTFYNQFIIRSKQIRNEWKRCLPHAVTIFFTNHVMGSCNVFLFDVKTSNNFTVWRKIYLCQYQYNRIQYNTLQNQTTQNNFVQCNSEATTFNLIQHSVKQHNILQLNATYCNSMRHTAMECNTLQSNTTCCNAVQHATMQ